MVQVWDENAATLTQTLRRRATRNGAALFTAPGAAGLLLLTDRCARYMLAFMPLVRLLW
jgi:hypothetical protein